MWCAADGGLCGTVSTLCCETAPACWGRPSGSQDARLLTGIHTPCSVFLFSLSCLGLERFLIKRQDKMTPRVTQPFVPSWTVWSKVVFYCKPFKIVGKAAKCEIKFWKDTLVEKKMLPFVMFVVIFFPFYCYFSMMVLPLSWSWTPTVLLLSRSQCLGLDHNTTPSSPAVESERR